MKFDQNTNMFCGKSCATSFDTGGSWGLGLSFNKPFVDDNPKYKLDEIETSKGKIYLKMRTAPGNYPYYEDNYGKDGPARAPSGPYPTEIEHYFTSEIAQFDRYCHSPVGMCLYIDLVSYYKEFIEIEQRKIGTIEDRYNYAARNVATYTQSASIYEKQRESIEKSLEGILLYKSEPFYNLIHAERKYPSCVLYIYDKGMKNEV